MWQPIFYASLMINAQTFERMTSKNIVWSMYSSIWSLINKRFGDFENKLIHLLVFQLKFLPWQATDQSVMEVFLWYWHHLWLLPYTLGIAFVKFMVISFRKATESIAWFCLFMLQRMKREPVSSHHRLIAMHLDQLLIMNLIIWAIPRIPQQFLNPPLKRGIMKTWSNWSLLHLFQIMKSASRSQLLMYYVQHASNYLFIQ